VLTLDGLKAYDGAGCRNIPTLSGILFAVPPSPHQERRGCTVCGKRNVHLAEVRVPTPVRPAASLWLRTGSDYLFVPDGDANTVKAAVVSSPESPAIRRRLRE